MPEEAKALTEAEIKAMMAAAGLEALRAIAPKDYESFARLMANDLAALYRDLSTSLYEDYLAALTQPPSPVVRARLMARASEQAKQITGNLAQSELNKIYERIAAGIEAGKGPAEIGRTLKEVKGLDAMRAARYEKYAEYLESLDISDRELAERLERFYQKELNERRKVIAQNEARNGTEAARAEEARQRGDKFKAWITSGDNRVSDGCADNEAAGAIPVSENFPSGDAYPPRFPGCRCAVSYFHDERSVGVAQDAINEKIESTRQARASSGE